MNNYDFARLNDKEFESIVIDLVSEIEKKRVERFKPGKDSGVDGRFFETEDAEVIIQCKHWHKSGLAALLRNLEKTEAPKVDKIKPHRYIFATSLDLSRKNKQTISALFSPHIKSDADILGKEDLEDLISKYPNVERKHYKLWLSSSNVINSILNAAIIGRSKFKTDEIKDFSARYVKTNNHSNALKILEELHAIIITGEPGIGKTTLADQLCLDYIVDGYELCLIEESVSEAEDLFNSDQKQLFYFDDFLGRNYILALNRHEDSHVINFIKRAQKSNGKRFILTSRSTVLNQGKRLSDLFRIENIDQNEYELNVRDITTFEKAKILYNHIYFGNLEDSFVEELYTDKRYVKIIRHKNFNPRLISFITDAHKVSGVNSTQYWSYIENTLNNPEDIWAHVYDHQLDDHSRTLLLLVYFNGRSISENDLKQAFLSYSKINGSGAGPSEFNIGCKLAVGAVLNRIIGNNTETTYDLFNPSLGDYILSRYSEDEDILIRIFKSLATKESLNNLSSLTRNKAIKSSITESIISSLLNYNIKTFPKSSTGHTLFLISLAIKTENLPRSLYEMVKIWLIEINPDNVPLPSAGRLFYIYNWALDHTALSPSELNSQAFLGYLLTDGLDHDDYLEIDKFLSKIEQPLMEIYRPQLKDLVMSLWESEIQHEVDFNGMLDDCYHESDLNSAFGKVYEHVEEILSEFSLEFDENDIEIIADQCDINGIIESNQENLYSYDEEWDRHEDYSESIIDEEIEIENLFER